MIKKKFSILQILSSLNTFQFDLLQTKFFDELQV